ncbi:hypothetical protein [Flavobacterium sp.]|uniref:hypothetical protein n=1 Tax=Flavobacterium sp. TaxID=239 RepID=UPI00260EE879|nr:hypothetical protein [Flavobacterium sp.]
MKKVIAIIALFVGFTINANAQQAKALSATAPATEKNFKEIIIQDVQLISKVVKVEVSLQNDLTNLLYMRKEAVDNSKTEEEKKAVFERYTSKLLGAFNEEQLDALKNNKELYVRLTQYSSK